MSSYRIRGSEHTNMNRIMYKLTIICFMLAGIQGVAAQTKDPDVIGMAVAGCVGFVLLSLVIAIIVMSFHWSKWFNNWMRLKGKVRMPKEYFRKKEEAKKKLISTPAPSVVSDQKGNLPVQGTNGTLPSRVINGKLPVRSNGRATLGQDWHQRTTTFPARIYEEKNAVMELGEEGEEEYKIETELVENETLDVGPFKHDHSKETAMKGDVYSDPYLYSVVDSTKKVNRSITKTTTTPLATSIRSMGSDYSTVGEARTSFQEAMVHL